MVCIYCVDGMDVPGSRVPHAPTTATARAGWGGSAVPYFTWCAARSVWLLLVPWVFFFSSELFIVVVVVVVVVVVLSLLVYHGFPCRLV